MCSPQPCTARALGPFSPPSMAATWGKPQEELGKTTNWWNKNIGKWTYHGCLGSQICTKNDFWGDPKFRKIEFPREEMGLSQNGSCPIKRPCKICKNTGNEEGSNSWLTPNWMCMRPNFRPMQTAGFGQLRGAKYPFHPSWTHIQILGYWWSNFSS